VSAGTGNIAFSTTQTELEEIFGKIGKVYVSFCLVDSHPPVFVA
jgi:hypothetical protein